MLGRVIGNLLVNAWKYTPEGGRVEVAAFSRPGAAGFTVTDTGIGIAEEHLPYIFERFYRADPSRSRATGGTGIGLSIVHELVRAMGGTVEVKSAPGEGSAFTVRLQAGSLLPGD
jgi:two-component system sensor histidine kinase BaeS